LNSTGRHLGTVDVTVKPPQTYIVDVPDTAFGESEVGCPICLARDGYEVRSLRRAVSLLEAVASFKGTVLIVLTVPSWMRWPVQQIIPGSVNNIDSMQKHSAGLKSSRSA